MDAYGLAEALATLQRKSIAGNALSGDFPYPGNLIEDGNFVSETEIISQGEVSGLWSDVLE